MKKIIVVALVIVMSLFIITACGNDEPEEIAVVVQPTPTPTPNIENNDTPIVEDEPEEEPEPEPEEEVEPKVVSLTTVGAPYLFGLREDGTVVNTLVQRNLRNTVDIDDWTDIDFLFPISRHLMGIKTDGSIVKVEVSRSHVEDHITPIVEQIAETWTDIVDIDWYTNYGVMGVRTDGTLIYLPFHDYRGDIDVSGITDIVEITANRFGFFALRSDGTVVRIYQYRPYGAPIENRIDFNYNGWTDIVSLSSGPRDSLVGVKSNGTLVWNNRNQRMEQLNDWTDVVSLGSFGGSTFFGLRSDGTLHHLQLGDNPPRWWETVSTWTDLVQTPINAHGIIVGLKSDGSFVFYDQSSESTKEGLIDIINGWTP